MIDPPYYVYKCAIVSFGDRVDIQPDGNYFFTALWEANQQNVSSKNNVDMNDLCLKIHRYASRNWPQIVQNLCRMICDI